MDPYLDSFGVLRFWAVYSREKVGGYLGEQVLYSHTTGLKNNNTNVSDREEYQMRSDDLSDLFEEGPTLIEEFDVEKLAESAAKQCNLAVGIQQLNVINDMLLYYREHFLDVYTLMEVTNVEFRDYGVVRFLTRNFNPETVRTLVCGEFERWSHMLQKPVMLHVGVETEVAVRLHLDLTVADALLRSQIGGPYPPSRDSNGELDHSIWPLEGVVRYVVTSQDSHGRIRIHATSDLGT